MQIVNQVFERTILGAVGTSTVTLGAVDLRLYKNDYTPSGRSLFSNFTEADFTGYAKSVGITWGTPYGNPSGDGEMIGEATQFTLSDTTTTNTIYGYFLTKGADSVAVVVAAEKFDQPITLGQVDDAIVIVPPFSLAGTSKALVQGP